MFEINSFLYENIFLENNNVVSSSCQHIKGRRKFQTAKAIHPLWVPKMYHFRIKLNKQFLPCLRHLPRKFIFKLPIPRYLSRMGLKERKKCEYQPKIDLCVFNVSEISFKRKKMLSPCRSLFRYRKAQDLRRISPNISVYFSKGRNKTGKK